MPELRNGQVQGRERVSFSVAKTPYRGIFALAVAFGLFGCQGAPEDGDTKEGKAQPAETSADAKEAEAAAQQVKVKTSRVRFRFSPREKLARSGQQKAPDKPLSIRVSSEGLGFDPHECLRSNIRNHRPDDIRLELDLLSGPQGEGASETTKLPSALGGSRTLPLTCLPAEIQIELNGMAKESVYQLALDMQDPSGDSFATYKAKSPIIRSTAENDDIRSLSFNREAGASSAAPPGE